MSFQKLQKSYGAFENELFQMSDSDGRGVILHKNLVVAAGWGLIYNKKSNPQYGYYRAEQLLNDFNSHFSWNLPTDIYKSIFEKDYSLNNEENRRLLEKKKKSHQDSSRSKRKRKHLFRR